ncbi:hypothetical protein Mesau_02048 [Mesorhizobium australicum WSM2073]|uniref:Uncharacterized protein n=1 Tax=Mesorhizobium australicum (strain HAMBI 3006 / LMG 24608 / WSM2073) TaxID=754035 RepID=L0KHK4_MESAW|nr:MULTISPECIES: hypothetical protein [Mesorhizobium]AGB44491.1 hypothetical protein Mesau_02048 [Mesorhizobium australicum WSM2073]TPM00740.1 hypothetical protein FJ943_11200 [Mesorhizobium sp. B2-3-10]
MADTVLRFVTHSTHPPFGYRSGVFKVAYELRRTLPPLTPRFEDMAEQLSWFETNLAVPTRFSTSRHPRAQETAISWIRSSAKEHVRRLRLLVALVEELGHTAIDEIRTERPGYVVFEDDHQVVALPFADTPR